MEFLFSKLSLYDLLAMIIPGGILLYICTICTGISFHCNISVIGWGGIATLAYLLGLINHQLTACIWRPFRNNPIMLAKSRRTFLKRNELHISESDRHKMKTGICDTYYKAYYKVIQHRYNNDIPIMEGQIAFMQSMFLPLVLITLVVATDSNLQWCCPCIRILVMVMVIFIISIILTIYARQMKIYNRVWEDDKYLNNEKNQ